MKFRFKNLGPIKEADLELGDLTVIAGRNNTGKTYIAYALYGFLKRWNWSAAWLRNPTREEAIESIEEFSSSLVRKAASKGFATRTFSRHQFTQQRSAVANAMARTFSASGLAAVFSSQRGRFEGASVEFISSLPDNTPPPDIIYSSLGSCRVSWEEDKIVMSVDVLHERPESRPAIFAPPQVVRTSTARKNSPPRLANQVSASEGSTRCRARLGSHRTSKRAWLTPPGAPNCLT